MSPKSSHLRQVSHSGAVNQLPEMPVPPQGCRESTQHSTPRSSEKSRAASQSVELVQPPCKATEGTADPGAAQCSSLGEEENLGEKPQTHRSVGSSSGRGLAPCDAGNVRANLGGQHTPSSTAKGKQARAQGRLKAEREKSQPIARQCRIKIGKEQR